MQSKTAKPPALAVGSFTVMLAWLLAQLEPGRLHRTVGFMSLVLALSVLLGAMVGAVVIAGTEFLQRWEVYG